MMIPSGHRRMLARVKDQVKQCIISSEQKQSVMIVIYVSIATSLVVLR